MSGKNEHGNCKNVKSAIFGTLFTGAPEPPKSLPECYPPSDPAYFDGPADMKALRGRHSGATYFVEFKFKQILDSGHVRYDTFKITRKDPQSGREEERVFEFVASEHGKGIPEPTTYEHALRLYEELIGPIEATPAHHYVSIPFKDNAPNVRVVAYSMREYRKNKQHGANLVIKECCLQKPSRYSFVNVDAVGKNSEVTPK